MSDAQTNHKVQDARIIIPLPKSGQVSIFSATPASCFVLPFDSDDAAFIRRGDTLVIEKHGATIILSKFFDLYSEDDLPRLALPDGAELTAEAVAEALDPMNNDFITQAERTPDTYDTQALLLDTPVASAQCSTTTGTCTLPDATTPYSPTTPSTTLEDDAAALQQFLITHAG